MKNPFGSRLKIFGLSLLIIAMTILMYDPDSTTHFKYWIGVIIIVVSLILINYEYFIIYRKIKNDKINEQL